ncbi:MAG: hypothetical protein Q8P13_01665 [bacterium]|nr:hypothetical protein [bacterium]
MASPYPSNSGECTDLQLPSIVGLAAGTVHFVVVVFFEFLAIMLGPEDSLVILDTTTGKFLGLGVKGWTAAAQFMILFTAVTAWARAISATIDRSELLWIIGAELFFAAISYGIGKLIDNGGRS